MMSDQDERRLMLDNIALTSTCDRLKAEVARLEGMVEELQAEALVLFRKSQSLIDEKADLQRDIEMCHDERISQNSGTE